jgi:ribulose-5-phosphate 4-epimerase/fuculose-1-phosphate aldolase
MIAALAARSDGTIRSEDAETRVFLGAIPVARTLEAAEMTKALAGRRCAVLADGGVVACGTVSPEEAFISFSSACFVCYVKFVADALAAFRRGVSPDANERRILALAFDPSHRLPSVAPALMRGPLEDEISARSAMVEAGRATVQLGLVGACFGNVSCLAEGLLHISRTGASLDELEAGIVSVPLDGSGSAGKTASSDLIAHFRILERTGARAVLHGHPRHAVIASLDCDHDDCLGRGACHLRCDAERFAAGAPIVSGEAGTGPHGSCNTVSGALIGHPAAILYGHGVFATGAVDFNDALQSLIDVERACFDEIAGRLL